ncbi:MAG: hypothetical protein KTR22_09595 [Flavobacteriaceae bacterium]|nr:hypothetical protein [Flavobacteriaceae bacterium]
MPSLRKIAIVVLLFQVMGNHAQEIQFERGKVIDSVAVNGSDETFALYLPTQYDPEKLSSVIYIFEPAARAPMAVQLFSETAETYNHILVCSNHTRNFRADNFDIINRLFDTVFSTFNIDGRQVYTAGFSGGSRLATSVAVLTNQVEGVIGCGAGFSPNPAQTPNPSHKFSYLGMVGALDMNYHEMYNAKTYLEKINIENELFTNGDVHKWPSSEQLVKAIGWLELQAYKKGIKEKNNEIINDLYHMWYEEGKALEDSGSLVKAVAFYERLQRNFLKYHAMDSINKKISSLRNTKEYLRQAKIAANIEVEEEKVKKVFFDRLKKELNASSQPTKFKWWNKEFAKLKEKYTESDELPLRELGARVENMIFAAAVETAQVELGGKNMKKVFYCHRLLVVLQPESAYPQFLLAKDFALQANKPKMLEHLYLAKEKGLSERKYIDNEKAFQPFRNDSEFKEFVEGLN